MRAVGVAEPRFALELTRLKGDALLTLKRFREARAVYEQVLACGQCRGRDWDLLAPGWHGELEQAKIGLTELLADAPSTCRLRCTFAVA